MTTDEMRKAFDSKNNDDEFLKFERIKRPLHRRPDLCAFLMLDALVPGSDDMVSAVTHDEIFLDVNVADLAAVATDEVIRDLHRCGVRFSSAFECLAMFV